MVRKIKAKQILKRHSQSVSGRAIAGSLGISRSSVAETLGAAADAGVSYADIASKSDDEVCALLFPGRNEHASACRQPDWEAVHRELAKTGVTLRLLHAEESATAYLFVACLPFGRYAFVEPALDMGETTWLRCHVAMYEWLGGSTPRLVPDNLKTGVTAHPREGEIVPDERYRALADHYSAAVLPGRVKRPRDKASVENTVWHATMAVIGAMRNRTFRSCI